MTILSAFGNQSIQDALARETEKDGATFAHSDYEWQGEIIAAAYEHKDTDVIMVYTGISGNMDRYTFVRSLVANATAEIILIDDDNEKEFKEYCASLGITITLKNGKINLGMLADAVKEACKYSRQEKELGMDIMCRESKCELQKGIPNKAATIDERSIKRAPIKARTVGVMGLKAGSGATGIAADICELLLRREKCRIALLENDGREDLKNYAKRREIDLFANETLLRVMISGNYDYAVTDFGAFCEFNKEGIVYDSIAAGKDKITEFMGCDLKLMVCRGEEWDIDKLKTVLDDGMIPAETCGMIFFLNGGFQESRRRRSGRAR